LDIPGNPFPEAEPLKIDQNGIEKLLQNLNPSRAAGPDNLPSQVLKHCVSQVAPILIIIFRHSIKTGVLPADWLSAIIAFPLVKNAISKCNIKMQYYRRYILFTNAANSVGNNTNDNTDCHFVPSAIDDVRATH